MLLLVAIVVSDFGLAPKTGTRKVTNSGTKSPVSSNFPYPPLLPCSQKPPPSPPQSPPAPRSISGQNLRTMYELCTPLLQLAKKLLETRAKRLSLHDPPGPQRYFLGRENYFGKFRGHRCVWVVYIGRERKEKAENQGLFFVLSFCVYAGRRLVGGEMLLDFWDECMYLLCTPPKKVKSK